MERSNGHADDIVSGFSPSAQLLASGDDKAVGEATLQSVYFVLLAQDYVALDLVVLLATARR